MTKINDDPLVRKTYQNFSPPRRQWLYAKSREVVRAQTTYYVLGDSVFIEASCTLLSGLFAKPGDLLEAGYWLAGRENS